MLSGNTPVSLAFAHYEDMVRRRACGDRSDKAVEAAKERLIAALAAAPAQAGPVTSAPEGWREFLANLACPRSEPLNSVVAYRDRGSRALWAMEIRETARALLARAPQPARATGETAKLEGGAA